MVYQGLIGAISCPSGNPIFIKAIAHDKGKPSVRWGRKAKSLQQFLLFEDGLATEGDRRRSPLKFLF
jgi:hypothetical protein